MQVLQQENCQCYPKLPLDRQFKIAESNETIGVFRDNEIPVSNNSKGKIEINNNNKKDFQKIPTFLVAS